jgi:hypothetical protein
MLERRVRQSLCWKAHDKRPQFSASGEAVGASRTSIGEYRGSFMLLEDVREMNLGYFLEHEGG